MKDCQRATEVFRYASAAEDLPAGLAAHAVGCPACQASLERARRFDAELHAGAAALATPALPHLTQAEEPSRPASRVALAGATIAAAVVITLAAIQLPTIGPSVGFGPEVTQELSPSPSLADPTQEPSPRLSLRDLREEGLVPPDPAPSRELPAPDPVTVRADALPAAVVDWSVAAKEMVWMHTAPFPLPDGALSPELPLVRLEMCGDFAIVFFDASAPEVSPEGLGDADLLWAAGLLSEPPEGADGGWVREVDDLAIQPYRADHAPCDVSLIK